MGLEIGTPSSLIALETLRFKCEIESLISEREAMTIFNTSRLNNGYAPGYDENAFIELQKKFNKIGEELKEYITKLSKYR